MRVQLLVRVDVCEGQARGAAVWRCGVWCVCVGVGTRSNCYPAAPVYQAEELAEIKEFFDLDSAGNLKFTGFCDMYHTQSSAR